MSGGDQEPNKLRARGKVSTKGLEGEVELTGFDRAMKYLAPSPVERIETAVSQRIAKNIRAGRPMYYGCDEATQELALGIFQRERRKEKNLEAVTGVAQRELLGAKQRALPPAGDSSNTDPEDDGSSTDPDWFTRFRSYASEVSIPEVQEIWGRILAGEGRYAWLFLALLAGGAAAY